MPKRNHRTESNPTRPEFFTHPLHESLMQEFVARARWFCDGRAIERDVTRHELIDLIQDPDVEIGFVNFFST